MNILIIGNGFDLSHFLPTKYDHFMSAMKEIERFEFSTSDMNFDDIYKELIISGDFFISKTKELYNHKNVILNKEQLNNFKSRLINNTWYKYFLSHVNDIKTWIDFEQKIEEALTHTVNAINIINEKHLTSESFNIYITTKPTNGNNYFFTNHQFTILSCLNLINENNHSEFASPRTGKLNANYFKSEINDFYGFDSNKFLSFLENDLDEFIEIFNLYIELIIDKLTPHTEFQNEDLKSINKVFSFNYTNSFIKFYKKSLEVEHLHGKFGLNQNIVLGISDLKNESLKNLRAYGFTKYHQKILKETQYEFLNDSLKKNKRLLNNIEENRIMQRASISNPEQFDKYRYQSQELIRSIPSLKFNIFIWGHSLDVSDEIYINEIFSFNEGGYKVVHVVIYYYDKRAKSDLLKNLFHILGQHKIENWMKNKWLEFKENPSLNAIKKTSLF
ncbi:AbiH family protein [Acinetobacter higginsii]|uniref:AbiH family protein n=1 Tax=Acinetobacter higginsii TaxID=70347 RepID=UPI0026760A72|nr:AbiH family protein [Acinetobacter higginsii]MDO3663436.1 AbiH family protein [Acinetobacter higginsii]